jgi:uncharacterized protein
LALVRRSLRWTERLYQTPAAALLIALLFVAVGAPSYAADDTLEIVSKTGVHVFAVELAVSDEQRSRGLMFRRSLPEGQGMLFKFEPDQIITMWMHNTYIPLDMIFIGADMKIVGIEENAEPLTRTARGPDAPSQFVLEVPGGWSRLHGVQPGARVSFVNVNLDEWIEEDS